MTESHSEFRAKRERPPEPPPRREPPREPPPREPPARNFPPPRPSPGPLPERKGGEDLGEPEDP